MIEKEAAQLCQKMARQYPIPNDGAVLVQGVALMSLAISMKRIADSLKPDRVETIDIIAECAAEHLSNTLVGAIELMAINGFKVVRE